MRATPVRPVLRKEHKMAIGTYEQYIERMKKMRPNVYLNGQ